MLGDRARSWVAAELGSQVESVSVLTGGIASQMLAVRTVAGTEAVLRRMTVEPWRTFAAELLGREFEVQTMLAVRTAADADADSCRPRRSWVRRAVLADEQASGQGRLRPERRAVPRRPG